MHSTLFRWILGNHCGIRSVKMGKRKCLNFFLDMVRSGDLDLLNLSTATDNRRSLQALSEVGGILCISLSVSRKNQAKRGHQKPLGGRGYSEIEKCQKVFAGTHNVIPDLRRGFGGCPMY